MLVRKIKCNICGANKVNEISTSYIYCDYCGSLMGYDIEMLQGEAKEIFSVNNLSHAPQQKFLKFTQELGTAIKGKDKDQFIELQLQLTEIEFDLYKKRFSPKIKQPAFRKKFIDFYRKFWAEQIDNGYFEKSAEQQVFFKQMSLKVKTEFINGENITTFDENFIEFLDAMTKFNKESIDEIMQMKCIEYYPEGNTELSKNILYNSFKSKSKGIVLSTCF